MFAHSLSVARVQWVPPCWADQWEKSWRHLWRKRDSLSFVQRAPHKSRFFSSVLASEKIAGNNYFQCWLMGVNCRYQCVVKCVRHAFASPRVCRSRRLLANLCTSVWIARAKLALTRNSLGPLRITTDLCVCGFFSTPLLLSSIFFFFFLH